MALESYLDLLESNLLEIDLHSHFAPSRDARHIKRAAYDEAEHVVGHLFPKMYTGNMPSGIHHITAITGDPQKNVDFYEGFLGQRLVKRTVNFDDPRSYHFYFGDAVGTPGTLLTFFYFGPIPTGTRGTGEVSRIAYSIPSSTTQFWKERADTYRIPFSIFQNPFNEEVISLKDPDGIAIDLICSEIHSNISVWKDSDVPAHAAIQGFHGATLVVVDTEDMTRILIEMGYRMEKHVGQTTRYVSDGSLGEFIDCVEAPDLPKAREGCGSVHHIAFRSENDEIELELRSRMEGIGLHATAVIDRNYFHSVYFMTPSGILFEIATDPPGFAIDEPLDQLGETLVLPPQLEADRERIVKNLVPITLPRHRS